LLHRIVFVALALGLASTLSAQLDRATLTGAVTDMTGAVVPNAAVTVSSEENGLRRSTQTNETGGYAFPQLPIGVYAVTVAHPGMRTLTTSDVRLGVGDNRTLNVQLEVSGTDTSGSSLSSLAISSDPFSIPGVAAQNVTTTSWLPPGSSEKLDGLGVNAAFVEVTALTLRISVPAFETSNRPSSHSPTHSSAKSTRLAFPL
jgi:hypothetical protein